MIRSADALAHIRRLRIPSYGDDEVVFMARTVLKYRPDMVFDWGTNVGASARIFYEVAKLAGVPCEVHTFELADERAHREHPGHRYAELLLGVPVHCHLGDGVTLAASLVERRRPVRPLFFVDGDHLADNVMRELGVIASVAPHGVILVHDTRAHAGDGVAAFRSSGGDRYYRHEFLGSQAGMTRLWPRIHVTTEG